MHNQIIAHLAKDIYPFHMPGHKRNPLFLPPNLQVLDMTEIPGMDVLSSPTGMIYDLQQKIANFYGAGHSFLLVNGSSAGIIAAICATCADGDTLIVPRNAHASVYNGMVQSGTVPQYIMPQFTECGLAGGICPSAFDNMPPGAVALVVSPTYEGFVSDIRAIADKVHSRGGILIVDEAHGAHFAFHKSFPASALQLRADIVVQSFHKTLPMLSQTAVLHVNKSARVDINRVKFLINAVQTSSPSYILMSVCDFALQKLWAQPELFDAYVRRLEEFRASMPTDGGAFFLQQHNAGDNAIFATDPGKLLFATQFDAETVAEVMAREYKVQPEMAAGWHVLAMTSVADTDDGFARLRRAIYGITRHCERSEAIQRQVSSWPCNCDGQHGSVIAGLTRNLQANNCRPGFTYVNSDKLGCENNNIKIAGQARNDVTECNAITKRNDRPCESIPETIYPPRTAIHLPSHEIPWEESAGQISAQLIAQYPPGIAIVAPGERIPPGIPKQSETIRVISQQKGSYV